MPKILRDLSQPDWDDKPCPIDAWGHKPHIAEIRAHALNAGYDRAMADHVHDGRDPPGSTTVRLKCVAPIKRGHGRCKRWAVH